jgi:hypothetical protein
MTQANVPLSNFVGGEISTLLQGRTDLPVYKRGVERALNWVLLPQGPMRYRSGTCFVHHTRLNRRGTLVPFQFNDQQAYQIEVTEGYFRFYKDNAIILETGIPVSDISHAMQTVINAPSTFNNGDEVTFQGVGGTTGLNGRFYLVANAVPTIDPVSLLQTATTFTITDLQGNSIDTTPMGLYTSGGTVSRVYEIRTPYLEADLKTIQFTQNTDTMYVDHGNYEPRKLTRAGHTNWTLSRYTRQADPFESALAISGITSGVTTTVSSTANGHSVGDQIYIDNVVGMSAINYRHFLVGAIVNANSFTITNYDGTQVDSSGYGAYTSGGNLETINGRKYPRAVTFTADARVLHGGTDEKPESIFGSRAPTSSSGVRYDDFTLGTLDTDATIFTLAPVNGQVNVIQWLANTDKFIVAGTFGTVRRIYGASEASAVTPSAINAKSVNTYGAAQASPISLGTDLFYIQRGLQNLRSFGYDYSTDGYLTTDRNLVADHLPYPGLQQMCFQQASPDIIWTTRLDGVLLGLTFKSTEDISGWHRHQLGGQHIADSGTLRKFGRVLWASSMPRPTSQEQLWTIVERQINGITVRTVEYLSDTPVYPQSLDFYSDENGDEAEDRGRYENVLYERQKTAVHLDCSLTYNGADYSDGVALTLTDTTATASVAVFDSTMVGREIWGGYDENGDGGGRAVITACQSPTVVTIETQQSFTTNSLASEKWYLTTRHLSGLDHLEGQAVGINADGAPHNDGVVSGGTINLDYQASVVTVGLKYRALAKTLNIDTGGVTGSAQSKKRNVAHTAIRFVNSGGVKIGTNLYDMRRVEFRGANDRMDRPVPLSSDIKDETIFDEWDLTKNVFIVQDVALPCIVTVIDVFTDTTDE